MRRGIGVVCVVVSVLLFVKANDVANSIGSQLKRAITGAPVDAAMKLYLAAIITGLAGLLLIFWKKR
jgi:hypothetical protein